MYCIILSKIMQHGFLTCPKQFIYAILVVLIICIWQNFRRLKIFLSQWRAQSGYPLPKASNPQIILSKVSENNLHIVINCRQYLCQIFQTCGLHSHYIHCLFQISEYTLSIICIYFHMLMNIDSYSSGKCRIFSVSRINH